MEKWWLPHGFHAENVYMFYVPVFFAPQRSRISVDAPVGTIIGDHRAHQQNPKAVVSRT